MTLPGPAAPPADLTAAVEAYEAALAADDLGALADFFLDDAGTLRGDDAGLLVGSDEIARFRRGRGGAPARVLEHVEHRRVTDDAWLVTAVSAFRDGGRGLQTQLWARPSAGARWRIAVAHVSPRPRAVDRSVWRVVGDPLVGPSDDGGSAGSGPLAGLRVAVKDVFAVAGHRVGAGNPARLASVPVETEDAWAVARLRAGGAVVQGIATSDELAYSISGVNPHHGTPPNVHDPLAIPGGSSSGVGAAVALGQADVGLATDTAGSVRVPASYQGLWGLRTTHGLVPRDGVLPLAPTFDTVGWLTRDGTTLERVVAWTTAALTGQHGRPRDRAPRLLVPSAVVAGLDTPVREAFERWTGAAAARPGWATAAVDVGDLAVLQEAFRVVQAAEAWRAHGTFVGEHGDTLGPDVAARFRAAAAVTADEERAARGVVEDARRRLRDLLDGDLLVLPTTAGPPPDRTADPGALDAARSATLRLTTLAGAGGLPALSVPALALGDGRRRRSVGVSLIGAAGSDLDLVRAARALSMDLPS
ncbi:hypothetical protein GCM10009718_16310 [Isoptericola halotolerans]|uniref:Asp-tRNA(Asn)/Glu-tRNA(Gln) amidotransferase A subunit family amidase n=1 Tax=Isoptericola halotolerans TaxID=300560 RepID=A0ABX2A0N9_9MICO|nr:AtzH-like domain-containing protein [Isoptericola halotolerans]NOV95450.1 Asp-tRNA(Asn)/Glu-tRNA(Gln) amidotransferase A subunit family amidase [Isoptericola halotolerans]